MCYRNIRLQIGGKQLFYCKEYFIWKTKNKAGPGSARLKVKQLHFYSRKCTGSGVIFRWSKRGDLQQHNAPLSHQMSGATIQGASSGKDFFPSLPLCTVWTHDLSQPSKKNLSKNCDSLGGCFSEDEDANFPCYVCLVSYLTLPSFLPSLASVLWHKSHHTDYFYLSFLSKVHKRTW